MGGTTVITGEFSKRFRKSASSSQSAQEASPGGDAEAVAGSQPAPTVPHRITGSVLSADAKIFGDVEFTGEFQVNGELQGDARGGNIEVGEAGRVDGMISAEEVRVAGLVTGGVNARSVNVRKTGRILSDVEYVQLSVEAGAQLNGLITPRDAPSVAEVVSRVPPRRSRDQAEPKRAKPAGAGTRASRSGIKFTPGPKKDPRPLT